MTEPVDGPENSPNYLAGPPRRGRGVRRLNRVPLLIVVVLGGSVLAAIGYTYQARLARQRTKTVEAAAAAQKPEPANAVAVGVLRDAPTAGIIPPESGPKATPPAADAPRPNLPEFPTDGESDSSSLIGGAHAGRSGDPNLHAWERYRQRQDRIDEQRDEVAFKALAATTPVALAGRRGAERTRGAAEGSNELSEGQSLSDAETHALGLLRARAQKLEAIAAGSPPGAAGADEDAPDPNAQSAKQRFLSAGHGDDHVLRATRVAATSPYEVKAGTVIPAVMIGGVNSDLPGQILGQVSENVYDTATGRFVILPQGAKLVGTYQSAVTRGQSRVLVAWNRVIYPDASSVDLGSMPGTDQGGYAGFHDRVNGHYGRALADAALLSLFSAGMQLSQPQAAAGQNVSSEQTVAAVLGQQLGELGMETARTNLKIQPTLEIRPGYRFNVMVTKDLVLPPWQPEPAR